MDKTNDRYRCVGERRRRINIEFGGHPIIRTETHCTKNEKRGTGIGKRTKRERDLQSDVGNVVEKDSLRQCSGKRVVFGETLKVNRVPLRVVKPQ